MKRIINDSNLASFYQFLLEDEKSQATVDKYMRDLRLFLKYVSEQNVDKALVLGYKSQLETCYAATSVNSMLAAVNSFFRFMGWEDCCVKPLKIQKKAFCSAEKELTKQEYMRLIEAANRKGNQRLSLLIQTICGTGIRVSELEYITVEAAKKGEAVVSCKGKTRVIIIVSALRKLLLQYAKTKQITSGPIFITKNGKTMNRSNIWREMKSLCKQAGVPCGKVFPHNLRHLFARTFYGIDKDIAKLADILGHTSINTTRIYIMGTGDEHRRKLEHMKLVV